MVNLNKKKPINRIAKLRKENNLTIQQVADAIHVSNGTISRYEQGTREPKLATWQKLADFFNVSIPYLQGISNVKDQSSYEDYDKFAKEIYKNDIDFEDFLKERNNFYNNDTILVFHSLYKALKQTKLPAIQNKLDDLVSKLDKDSKIDDINFFTLQMFELALLNETSNDKEAKKTFNTINKVLDKYLKKNKLIASNRKAFNVRIAKKLAKDGFLDTKYRQDSNE